MIGCYSNRIGFSGKSEQGMYGDVIMEIDRSVGEIIKTLRDLDFERNTLVIFISDNGPWINYGNHAGNTAGLREGKGSTGRKTSENH